MITPPVHPDEPSPIARCLRIAAARGRTLRLAREQAKALPAEDQAAEDTSMPAAAKLVSHDD